LFPANRTEPIASGSAPSRITHHTSTDDMINRIGASAFCRQSPAGSRWQRMHPAPAGRSSIVSSHYRIWISTADLLLFSLILEATLASSSRIVTSLSPCFTAATDRVRHPLTDRQVVTGRESMPSMYSPRLSVLRFPFAVSGIWPTKHTNRRRTIRQHVRPKSPVRGAPVVDARAANRCHLRRQNSTG